LNFAFSSMKDASRFSSGTRNWHTTFTSLIPGPR
jgi:hypothetical protein